MLYHQGPAGIVTSSLTTVLIGHCAKLTANSEGCYSLPSERQRRKRRPAELRRLGSSIYLGRNPSFDMACSSSLPPSQTPSQVKPFRTNKAIATPIVATMHPHSKPQYVDFTTYNITCANCSSTVKNDTKCDYCRTVSISCPSTNCKWSVKKGGKCGGCGAQT